jgi:DNA-binding transcriptional regulator YiaG
MEILSMQDYYQAVALYIEQEQKQAYHLLSLARKKAGLSQRILALKLGLSAGLIADMERGRKLLNQKALEFIRSQDIETSTPPISGEQNAIDSKQVTVEKLPQKEGVTDILEPPPNVWRCPRCHFISAPTDAHCDWCGQERYQ